MLKRKEGLKIFCNRLFGNFLQLTISLGVNGNSKKFFVLGEKHKIWMQFDLYVNIKYAKYYFLKNLICSYFSHLR